MDETRSRPLTRDARRAVMLLTENPPQKDPKRHVCPYWVAVLLASPLRRLIENPDRILGPHVRPGMTVLDVGCALGFFTLPLAHLVGPEGLVIAVDLQERMIRNLQRRLQRAGLQGRVETRICMPHELSIADLTGTVDFAAAIHVIHETPDPEFTLDQIGSVLKTGARLLLMEPRGHVSPTAFAQTEASARAVGLREVCHPRARQSHAVLYEKI